MEEPYPGETVVSRAPNTWMLGHASFSIGMESTPPTRVDRVRARESILETIKDMEFVFLLLKEKMRFWNG